MTALEIVTQYYAAFNAKNWAGMLALLDPHVIHEVNQGETRVGLDKYEQFLGQMDESYEETLADLVLMSDATGTRIAAEFVVHGIYKKGDRGCRPPTGNRIYCPQAPFWRCNRVKSPA